MGIDIAIGAGGDGLVGGVITHIAESGLPLGILPLGTSNDIARSLNIPLDIEQAVEVIVSGEEQVVDIGRAQPAEQAPHLTSSTPNSPAIRRVSPGKHGYFAHALTVGLNVQFARLATNVVTRQRYGRMTYPFAALEVLRNHQVLEVELHFEGLADPQPNIFTQQQNTPALTTQERQMPLCCRAVQVAVINAPIFGGTWQLAIPGASVNDRLLDVVVIEDIELASLSTAFAQLFNSLSPQSQRPPLQPGSREQPTVHHPAELTGIPGIHHLQAQGITITTKADPQDVTLDGEVRGQTPMHVHLAPERLRVTVPR
jgi:diacylglycerol kinase family enzyme